MHHQTSLDMLCHTHNHVYTCVTCEYQTFDPLLRRILFFCLRPAAVADSHHYRATDNMQIVPAPKNWDMFPFVLDPECFPIFNSEDGINCTFTTFLRHWLLGI
jgi:hypothetical protein